MNHAKPGDETGQRGVSDDELRREAASLGFRVRIETGGFNAVLVVRAAGNS